MVLKSAKKDDSNLAREIHHHRQFLHPHIARLYEIIVTESLVWLVLEYCPGRMASRNILFWISLRYSQAMSCTTTYSTMAQSRWRKLRRFLLNLSELWFMYTICPVSTGT